MIFSYSSSCVEIARPFDKIPPGIWRAELKIKEDLSLPFNLQSAYNSDNELVMHVLNGNEKILISDVNFGRTKDLRDTIKMSFPLMDSYISAEYKENVMEGEWVVNYRDSYSIPFVAFHGQGHRFTTNNHVPETDLTGRWEATFEVETEDPYPAIGEFTQQGNDLLGTFLTETGDYRFLEGTVQGNELHLSCFDGGHAFLFNATISKSEVLSGKFYSGKHYETNWVAARNSEAVLTDPYQLSQITTPQKRIDFSLFNTEGELVSLSGPKYQGKPKLIMIMGTWCPNCLDESRFILEYLKDHPNQSIEVIALAFEKYRDEQKALSILKNYKERLKIPYDILHAGYYDKSEATKKLGFIDEVISYPTLLFVDRQNVVKKVHTGFAGPATSKWESFKTEFDNSIALILEE